MSSETVLLGSFSHETNTFATERTDLGAFRKRREVFGTEIADELAGTNTAIGGAIDVAGDEVIDLRYTVAASATPGGVVTTDAYRSYSEAILEGVREHADDLDGVFLALHGAMVPEGRDDGEGPLVSAVRDVVGRGCPIVLADTGDNPGGGGAGDGTAVLRALLDRGPLAAIADRSDGGVTAGVAIVRDPAVVSACVEAGVGETVTVTLGGKTDDHHGDPIEGLKGYVKGITDGEFVNTGPMGTGTSNDLGRTIRFECGEDRSVTTIVTENRLQPLDAEIWRHVGVQPERLDVLVGKSMNHFRADYEPMASEVIPINSPGLSTMDPRRFDFERVRRPLFPIDEVTGDEYPP